MQREAAYLKALKSIVLSPLLPDDESVRRFLVEMMDMDEEVADDLKILEIMRLHARRLPNHRKEHASKQEGQVRVCFNETYKRDAVMSYTSALEDGCSIEAVFPEHLGPL